MIKNYLINNLNSARSYVVRVAILISGRTEKTITPIDTDGDVFKTTQGLTKVNRKDDRSESDSLASRLDETSGFPVTTRTATCSVS